MASYIDNPSQIQTLTNSFSRTKNLPLDRTSMFSTYLDAVEYAKGPYKAEGETRAKAHDERKLAGSSYIGQIITVYENDVVTVYKIDFDRTLKVLGGGSVDCGEYI